MKKTIATFAFLTMTFMASATDHYWIGPVTGGRWSDKNNWSSKKVPNSTSDGCYFTNNVTVITDTSTSMSTLNFRNGCHITFKGDEVQGTSVGVTSKKWNFYGGATVTLDGCYAKGSASTWHLDAPAPRLILTNGCFFVAYDAAGGTRWPDNTYIEINDTCRFANFGIGSAGTNCTFVIRNGANMTGTDKATIGNTLTNTTILVEGGSTLTHPGNYTASGNQMQGVRVIVREHSTLALNGALYLNRTGGNLLSVEGGSTVSITGDLRTGTGSIVSNDNSKITVGGKLSMAQADKNNAVTAGEKFFFIGEDAQMVVAGAVEFNNVAAASAGATFNFAVPELGFKDAPFRATSTSAKIFGNPTNIKPNGANEKFVHVKLLASSPALDPSYAYATLSKLFFTYAGLQKRAFLDCQVLGADNQATFLYTTVDGQTEAATDANVRYILARMENGAGGKPLATRAVTESKGVAENTVIASVSRRLYTMKSAVTQLAEAPLETYAVLYAGETSDSLVAVAETQISSLGNFQMTWSGTEYLKTYRLRIALETRNALGEVTYTELSPVKSAATVDATTYTWRDVDGDWTGNWSDSRHWSDNQNGDCYGSPASKDASVVIPAGHPIVINLDAAYTVDKVTTVGANTSLRLTAPAGKRDANKLTANAGSDYWNIGNTGNTIVFDGVNIYFPHLKTSIGQNATMVFTNSAYCVFKKIEVHHPGLQLRILDGSYVELLDTASLLLGSPTQDSPSGLVVDNATLNLKNQLQFYSVASAVRYSSITIRGRTGKIKCASTIYSESTSANDHRIIFDVPAGGYASVPFELTATSGNPAFYLSKSGALIGAVFEIAGDSAAYEPREESDIPLFSAPTGINRQYVSFVRPNHAGRGNTFLYGTATASPYGWTPAAGFSGTAKAIGLRVFPLPHTVIMVR